MLPLSRLRSVPIKPLLVPRRLYHGEGVFGHFPPPTKSSIPDYPPSQLENRNVNAALLRYVDNVRRHGHRAAKIDPLDMMARESEVAALDPSRYGLRPDEPMLTEGIVEMPADSVDKEGKAVVRSITTHLQRTYVSSVGYEFMHMNSKGARNWFMDLLERGAATRPIEKDCKRRIWELMARSECLDQFLQAKLPNVKRYGLEGGEAMIPCIDAIFELAAAAGISDAIVCMPHRGRLGFLTELLQFPPERLLSKMKGHPEVPEQVGIVGDVLSHLTASPTLEYGKGDIRVELLPNPSHLEAVNPVAVGLTRATQTLDTAGNSEKPGFNKALCVQVHGDAAFTGQGLVMETLGLSELPHFAVGGSIHILVNNNLGFSTPSSYGRSSMYASDVAKMIGAPVLHVNGDNPEAVIRAASVAFAYRQTFARDIVIDLIVYRRWGHNELDEPAFTQPLMYNAVRTRKSVPQLYETKLIEEDVLSVEDARALRERRKADFEAALHADVVSPKVEKPRHWAKTGFSTDTNAEHAPDTGVEANVLRAIGAASVEIPPNFEPHSRLSRHVKQRKESLESGSGILWATAEALAFGSLMQGGFHVRLSGQDVGRGTFSQRHAMFVDRKDEKIWVPLNAAELGKGKLELVNSSLSEQAVLAFELGMSWHNPDILPIWEAQFGDFNTGAQVIIDTFLSSGEAKWMRQSALTMLLPHGLEGGGPEHSSARIERFLQLTNDPYEPQHEPFSPNMIVANPTTPAQYFHLLRRQMQRNYRKPLIVATPKGMLRAAECTSSLSDFEPGTSFQPVLLEPGSSQSTTPPKRIIFCSGRHYFTLLKARTERNLSAERDVALIRIEQLAPFPFDALREGLSTLGGGGAEDSEWVWAQEEARNQGGGAHVIPRLEALMADMKGQQQGQQGGRNVVRYAGRRESAVPATGVGAWHKAELAPLAAAPFEGL
ncbi:unnamed protein product [Tilletia laevis]|nr:hypothetical protein CF335_g1555 [Tilletia laevis]CAD6884806.1 unnamed protein product [Tilletia caries]CAD6948192.1 unnamed protein product [Tilletia caries]CAD6966503.1 unnamed protein product [Tilletia laevis]